MFHLFRRKKIEISDVLHHDLLGNLLWDEAEHCWQGSFKDWCICIDRENGRNEPSEALWEYTEKVLERFEEILQKLDAEIQDFIASTPELTREQWLEVENLVIESASFISSKAGRYTFFELSGGKDGRCWRLELHGLDNFEFGCDS